MATEPNKLLTSKKPHHNHALTKAWQISDNTSTTLRIHAPVHFRQNTLAYWKITSNIFNGVKYIIFQPIKSEIV